MKNVLVIQYSQSGQLTDILQNVTASLKQAEGVNLTEYTIAMKSPYPFPWPKDKFFDVFPETFQQIPQEIKPIPDEILDQKYDLILFGYTVWYLTPSLPTLSFLATPGAKRLFENTPVVTIIGCRNMWIMAQEKLKRKLASLNAKLVGNIVLVDRHINHISVITIVQWMFTGEKKRYLGIFPKPGVSDADINDAKRFGPVLLNALQNSKWQDLQHKLLIERAVVVKPFLIKVDKTANKIFDKWSKLILKKSQKRPESRKFWLKLFNYYLIIAIWIISPIVFILFLLTYVPLRGKIKKEIRYYKSVQLQNFEQ